MRIGILDVGAAGVTLFAILLPPAPSVLEPVYDKTSAELARPIAAAQAELAQDPKNGEAAERLTEYLLDADQSDWALRVSSAASAREDSATRWRALLAVSAVHADRLEMKPALEWASMSLGACQATTTTLCLPHDRVRLNTYVAALQAGVESGVDPKVDPAGFDQAIRRKLPTITVRPPRKR